MLPDRCCDDIPHLIEGADPDSLSEAPRLALALPVQVWPISQFWNQIGMGGREELNSNLRISGTIWWPQPPDLSEKYCRTNVGGILPYKRESYSSTNGRCTVGLPFLQGFRSQGGTAIQRGAYCRTNWRCTAALSPRPVGVGFLKLFWILLADLRGWHMHWHYLSIA